MRVVCAASQLDKATPFEGRAVRRSQVAEVFGAIIVKTERRAAGRSVELRYALIDRREAPRLSANRSQRHQHHALVSQSCVQKALEHVRKLEPDVRRGRTGKERR